MSDWGKSTRKERFQLERKNPSFSSTLLDEIYSSIDDSDKKQDKLGMKKKQSNVGFKSEIEFEEDKVSRFRRAYLIEQRTDEKVSEKIVPCRRQNLPGFDKKAVYENENTLFFSSSSGGSDSSSGEFSSETESFAGGKIMGSSRFAHAPPIPKPIRTSVSVKLPEIEKTGDSMFYKKQSKTKIFDQCHYNSKENDQNETTIKSSKLKVSNIYNNLKKMKQPISPGGRLTSFLNSIFTSANSKKTKESKQHRGLDQMGIDKTQKLTCSSATSFSRSCLNKTPNGVKKTVTFYPGCKIKDDFYHPRNQKSIDHKNLSQLSTPICPKSLNLSALKEKNELDFQLIEKNRPTMEILNRYYQTKLMSKVLVNNDDFFGNYKNKNEDDDDAASDSSSDLFELNNLEFIGKNYKRCDELPVYETTHVFTNRPVC